MAKNYPGMCAIAGPYAVNSIYANVAKPEKAYCVRALRDQQTTDPEAKVIMVGNFAWVIRRAEGLQRARGHEQFRGVTGIKAGRGAKA